MSRRPVWKRVVDVLVFMFLALAVVGAIFGLIHAHTWVSVVIRLGFLALFVSGLVEVARIMRRGWAGPAPE